MTTPPPTTERTRPSLTWLGQSGFLIESSGGQLCLLDAYLSDWAFEDIGTPRAIPPAIDLEGLVVSTVIATHWHHDHLDLPTCIALAAQNPDTVFIGPPSVAQRLCGRGIVPERVVTLQPGATTTHRELTLHGQYARHEVPGWLTEDALALVVEFDGIRIFVSGDTEYDRRVLTARRRGPFDVGLFVINGSGGNMNALEAALLAHQIGPAVAIPMHYGMWPPEHYGPEATLDPRLFVDTCAGLGGPDTYVMQVGERLELRARPPEPGSSGR